MEVELPLDLVNSCNFARKRQAPMESYTEILQSKKRPCLEDSSLHKENTSNMETENRLLSYTQPTFLPNQLHDYNQPLSDHNAATYNGHLDINCNIVYRVNNCQEMDISYDSAMTCTRSQAGQHQQNLLIPTLLAEHHLSSPSCSRCLRGEPGHINHLRS